MNKVIENPDLCIHDINNILLLLESFQKPILIEAFILYLHKQHPNLAKVVFKEIIFDTF